MSNEQPTAYTAEELQTRFMDHCRHLVDYWATVQPNDRPSMTTHDRLSGLLHSFLCIIDGVSGNHPALDLVARPHPDDKAFHQSEGERWVEPGTVINTTMLHEILYRKPGETA